MVLACEPCTILYVGETKSCLVMELPQTVGSSRKTVLAIWQLTISLPSVCSMRESMVTAAISCQKFDPRLFGSEKLLIMKFEILTATRLN